MCVAGAVSDSCCAYLGLCAAKCFLFLKKSFADSAVAGVPSKLGEHEADG